MGNAWAGAGAGGGAELAEIRIVFARAGGKPQPSPTSARRPEGRHVHFIPENQHFLFMGRKGRKKFSPFEITAFIPPKPIPDRGPDATVP